MREFSIFNIQFSIFFILACFLLLASNASAADLFLNVDKDQIRNGDIFYATLYLDTKGESINTIEADLKYDKNLIQAEMVNIGGSFVSFWVEKPDLKTPGIIHFSGIIPGGVAMGQGEILKIILRAKASGNSNLAFSNPTLFINDGQGTRAPVKTINKSIEIIEGGDTENILNLEDKTPPEKFNILRSRDESIFQGSYFLAFSAMDKESGVERYEVCELFRCTSGESPYLLQNQTPFYRVKVKAYDYNGNYTSSSLTSIWLIATLLLILLTIILYLCFISRKILCRK